MNIKIYSKNDKTYLVFQDGNEAADYYTKNHPSIENYCSCFVCFNGYDNAIEFTTENYLLYLESKEMTS